MRQNPSETGQAVLEEVDALPAERDTKPGVGSDPERHLALMCCLAPRISREGRAGSPSRALVSFMRSLNRTFLQALMLQLLELRQYALWEEHELLELIEHDL